MKFRQSGRPVHRSGAMLSSADHEVSNDHSSTDVQSPIKAKRSSRPIFIQNLGNGPDRARSIACYSSLAEQYDGSVHRILRLRQDTIDSLTLRPGEHVLDVACGTGDTLIELAKRVSPGGRVVGVEQSEEMAAVARAKVQRAGLDGLIDIHVCPAEELAGFDLYDAILMSFTHDVLQNPRAVDRLCELARPEARLAIAGMRFLPWWWAAPINLLSAFRARKYLTTFRGLRKPWSPLLRYVPDLHIQQSYWVGTCYRGVGKIAKHAEGSSPMDEDISLAKAG